MFHPSALRKIQIDSDIVREAAVIVRTLGFLPTLGMESNPDRFSQKSKCSD